MNDPMSFTVQLTEAYKSHNYEKVLHSLLRPLSVRHQIAFSASCADRLICYFTRFCEQHHHKPQDLRAIIDRVWQHLCGDMMNMSQINDFLGMLENVQFGEVDLAGRNAAIHAVNSIYLTVLACRENALDNAVQSAQAAQTIVDQYLLVRDFGISYVLHPDQVRQFHSRTTFDPLMLGEFSIQSAILFFLSQHSELGTKEIEAIQQIVQAHKPLPSSEN